VRILIYLEQESWGGVDTHLLSLLIDWPDKQDQITLVSNVGNQGFKRFRESYDSLDFVKTVEINSLSHNLLISKCRQYRWLKFFCPVLHFLQPLTYLLSTLRFIQLIKRLGNFDVVLSINGGYPAAWGTVSFLDATRKLGVSTQLLLVHHAATKSLPFMSWFEQIIDRRLSILADAVITVSNATRQSLLINRHVKDEKLNMPVIRNQVASMPSDVETINLRKALGVEQSDIVIGILGRIESYKGHADLIAGIGGVEGPGQKRLKLAIIGTGDEIEINKLKSLAKMFNIESQIFFMGFIGGKPSAIIEQLDLCAMVTRSFEGYGLTLVEAMQVGTPILATNVGAVCEFVDNDNGKLIPPSDPEAITMALLELIEKPALFLKRAKIAQSQVAHDATQMAKAYRRLMLMYNAQNGQASDKKACM